MNSSDQGVEPLDTAFKRRWKFNYIPLDFEDGCTNVDLDVVIEDGVLLKISWKEFAKAINDILTELGVPEDRHLGPYFISNSDLQDMSSILTGKIFMYLWDDVLRYGLRACIFDESITTYGMLVRLWSQKCKVFSNDKGLLDKIRQSSTIK